jgi:hypothetical protein
LLRGVQRRLQADHRGNPARLSHRPSPPRLLRPSRYLLIRRRRRSRTVRPAQLRRLMSLTPIHCLPSQGNRRPFHSRNRRHQIRRQLTQALPIPVQLTLALPCSTQVRKIPVGRRPARNRGRRFRRVGLRLIQHPTARQRIPLPNSRRRAPTFQIPLRETAPAPAVILIPAVVAIRVEAGTPAEAEAQEEEVIRVEEVGEKTVAAVGTEIDRE